MVWFHNLVLRRLVASIVRALGTPSKPTLLLAKDLTKEPLRDQLEILNATGHSEERYSYERGIRGGELQEAVAGGGGGCEEDITEPARGLPLAVDLDEHALALDQIFRHARLLVIVGV